jgi:2'-5' RNA ligase
MRLFFGIELSGQVRETVDRARSELEFADAPLKWVPSGNYHLTLKFLGETGEEQLPAIEEAAERVASSADEEFCLTLDEFGAFPSLSSPRVIFYSVGEGQGRLVTLAGDLDREMSSLGFRREKRRYHPHLTIARIRKRLPGEVIGQLAEVPPLERDNCQIVSSFQLIRSFLSSSGARYEKIADFRFPKS